MQRCALLFDSKIALSEQIQIGKLMPLISASIDNAYDLNFLRCLIYPKIDEEIFDRQCMNTLTVPGFFFRERDTIWELIQRSDFLLKRIQHFQGSIR